MEDTKKNVLEVLNTILTPKDNASIVSLGWVQNLRICEGQLAFDLALPLAQEERRKEIEDLCREKALSVTGVEKIRIQTNYVAPQPAPQNLFFRDQKILEKVKCILAVASGKGGVGKSTMATNLAVSLMNRGYKTGLLDGDIYGPSIPLMLGVADQEPTMTMTGKLIPLQYESLKVISIGVLTQEDTPLIWRGPLVTQLTQQFLSHVEWGELDYLIIDLPPGTGDIQITLCQFIALSGAVIVTTPQDVSSSIARKAMYMFDRLNVPILGVVENMSGYVCPSCQKETPIFGEPSLEAFCKKEELEFLGSVPLEKAVVKGGDEGKPIVQLAPNSKAAQAIEKWVDQVEAKCQAEIQTWGEGEKSPSMVVDIRQPLLSEIELVWGDDTVTRHNCHQLRSSCTCAVCTDEWSGEVLVEKNSIPLEIHPQDIKKIGNYAIQIEWSDGHKTGIYTFEHLRNMAMEKTESFEI